MAFTLLPAPHGDHHGLWIDPADPNRMINGDDGGATISIDGGKTSIGMAGKDLKRRRHDFQLLPLPRMQCLS